MRINGIKDHLRKQKIMGKKSTFSAAFASALAPFDKFDNVSVAEAIRDLGQNPERDLNCVYCGDTAATWDHVHRRVIGGEYSGYGHRIRNLVPCCRSCNERKGKRTWEEWLDVLSPPDIEERRNNMRRFLSKPSAAPFTVEDMRRAAPRELSEFLEIRQEVFRLMKKADDLADVIRETAIKAHSAR
ncbi:HNH endonuclease [Azospirillum argentinense]|uniref:HNH endonuclease n=1 Tax=Azospirillum argentinense TaxID=2970906 RepID=A0ABW8VE38_9PROT